MNQDLNQRAGLLVVQRPLSNLFYSVLGVLGLNQQYFVFYSVPGVLGLKQQYFIFYSVPGVLGLKQQYFVFYWWFMLIHASPGYNMGLGEGMDGGGTEEVLGEERETELGVYI